MKSLKNGEYSYNEADFLGQGSFAKVYRGVIVKTERVIAVRLLPLKLIKQYGNKIKEIISIKYNNTRWRGVCLEIACRNHRC
jgi:serine/threonine protein kinase